MGKINERDKEGQNSNYKKKYITRMKSTSEGIQSIIL